MELIAITIAVIAGIAIGHYFPGAWAKLTSWMKTPPAA